ncbi:hypothetical protein I552_5079 [Mycobacterium xenopi 3993]|nr:hypothetical protein I552_5079 [Mycobacterium xenopi 3993]
MLGGQRVAQGGVFGSPERLDASVAWVGSAEVTPLPLSAPARPCRPPCMRRRWKPTAPPGNPTRRSPAESRNPPRPAAS